VRRVVFPARSRTSSVNRAEDGRLVEHTKTSAGIRTVAVVPSLGRALADGRTRATFDGASDPIFATSRGTHQDSHNLLGAMQGSCAPKATYLQHLCMGPVVALTPDTPDAG
jgi:hypothetical protein